VADTVLVQRSDRVATVVMNRPERLNAIDGPMALALRDALSALADDDAVRVVVLTGAGRGFCAGGDVHTLAGQTTNGDGDGAGVGTRAYLEVTEVLYGMDKPTIARINGPCAGAGLSFACACDLRFAAHSAVFVTAFLRVGASGDYGSAWLLARAVGPAKARELLLLGDRIRADEARRIGLVHDTVEDEALGSRVELAAAALAAAPPTAMANVKANLRDVSLPLGDYLDREAERFDATSASGEMRAAARGFLEAR